MEDDKIKVFQEDFPDVFDGANALIDSKIDSKVEARVEAKLREREFAKALNDAFPGWQQTWKTPAFQTFLNDVDIELGGLLGEQNYFVVKRAFESLESERAIRFFRIFFERGRKSPSSGPSGRAMSVEEARKRLKDLGSEKARGLWRNREKEYTAESDRLVRIITGKANEI